MITNQQAQQLLTEYIRLNYEMPGFTLLGSDHLDSGIVIQYDDVDCEYQFKRQRYDNSQQRWITHSTECCCEWDQVQQAVERVPYLMVFDILEKHGIYR